MGSRETVQLTVAMLPSGLVASTALVVAATAIGPVRRWSRLARPIAIIGLLGTVAACLIGLYGLRTEPAGGSMVRSGGGLVFDRFTIWWQVQLAGVGLFACLVSGLVEGRSRSRSAIHVALLLVVVLGGMVLAEEREMAAFLGGLGLILVAGLGMLAGRKDDPRAVRATARMAVAGSVALGLVAMGLAVFYGVAGTTDLTRVAVALRPSSITVAFAVAACVIGLAFFFGAPPWHHWWSDAADAAPPGAMAGFLGVGSLAAAGGFVRLVSVGWGTGARPWIAVVSVLASAAAVIPVLATPVRLRSAVALLASTQGGLIAGGLAAMGVGMDGVPANGISAVSVHATALAVAVVTTFGLVEMFDELHISDRLPELLGLARRDAAWALLIMVGLIGVAGVPPLVGFVTRFLVLQALVAVGQVWVAVFVALGGVLSLVFVVRVALVLTADEGEMAPLPTLRLPRRRRWSAIASAVTTGVLVLMIQPLLAAASAGGAALGR